MRMLCLELRGGRECNMIATSEVSYISQMTGSCVGGKVAEYLQVEHLNPFRKVIQNYGGTSRLEFVFDYYGIRYHLLLEHNAELECCKENILLSRVAECLHQGTGSDAVSVNCLDLFWSVVADDSAGRQGKTTEKATMKDRFREKDTVKIQLVTGKNGILSRKSHDKRCLYPFSDPIKNPCPSTIRLFQMEEIEFLEEISHNVFKANIGNATVCVKAALIDQMCAEVETLMRMPRHTSLISPLLGVVDAGEGRIDKFIIPFIVGKQLSNVKAAAMDQKTAWKAQISEAISLLHKTGIAWVDGSPWNVLIDDKSGRAVLIDFGESSCQGSEDFDAEKFEAMKRVDIKSLAELDEFIDGIPPAPGG